MRKAIAFAGLLAIMASCKKKSDTDTGGTPVSGPALQRADVARDYAPGKSVIFFAINGNANGAITVPQAGANQTWNFSSITSTTLDTMRTDASTAAGLASATYSQTDTRSLGAAATPQSISINNFLQVTDAGWRALGRRVPSFALSIPGTGSMNYAAQTVTYAPAPLPLTPAFPVRLNDSVAYTITITENATVSVPPLLNNTPASQRTTITGSARAMATGKISLNGFPAQMDVMIIRRDVNTVDNFLLNGVTPPAQLLQQLGLQDGQTSSTTYYDLYNYGGIGHLGYIIVRNGAVIGARLRRAG